MRNVIKRLVFAIVLTVSVSAAYALAPPALKLDDGSRNVTIDSSGVPVFGGACTPATCSTAIVSASAGSINWGGKIGNFNIPVVAAITKPVSTPPSMDVSIQGITTGGGGGGTLTVTWTDVDFNAAGGTIIGGQMQAGGSLGGSSILFRTYLDGTDAPFGTGTLVGSLSFSSSPYSGSFTSSTGVPVPFSMTESIALTMSANATVGGDFSLQALVQPSFLQCRMTGGGVDTSGNWDHTLTNGQMVRNTAHNLPPNIDRYTFGGQAGAPTASQPQPHGHWEHHQQTGPSGSFDFGGGDGNVTGTRIVEIRCSDPGACKAAANAPAKQLDFDAIGTFQHLGTGQNAPNFLIPNANVIVDSKKVFTYHWFQVNVDDLGEPGGTNTGNMPAKCPARGYGEKSAGPYTNPTTGVTTILPYAPLGDCDCPDFYRISIFNGVSSDQVKFLPDGRVDPNSLDKTNLIYEVFGYIDGGNLQLHPAI